MDDRVQRPGPTFRSRRRLGPCRLPETSAGANNGVDVFAVQECFAKRFAIVEKQPATPVLELPAALNGLAVKSSVGFRPKPKKPISVLSNL
jgi:hypothetical protein